MVSLLAKEGKAPFDVPSIKTPCFTYYKIIGDVSCGKPPLLVMHGGPGVGHEYLIPFSELWPQYGIPVVFYDHLGCASSTRLPQTAGDKSFWTSKLFVAQLDSIIDYLNLRDGPGFDLLGHSFGGMIGSAWASTRPRGLRRLILASGLASMDLSIQSLKLRVSELPTETQQVINSAKGTEDFETPVYKTALNTFLQAFFCRTDPLPPELRFGFKYLAEDNTVYGTMHGPAMLVHTGSMLGWTAIPDLHMIDVPTLVYNGEFDTSHDISQIPFFELIPRVRWVTIPGGGHMCHVEGEGRRERVLKFVGDFLTQEDL